MNKLKPLEELTPSQKEFLGTEFPTPNGGVLRVVGVLEKKSGRAALFEVKCSLCSKDKELFTEGFSSPKGSLVGGCVPCGCARRPKWTEAQFKVMVERECKERGYEFLGWAEEYKGIHTKLKLYNPATGNTWDSTSINNFMRGQGDPEERRLNTIKANTVPDEVHIKEFMQTGKFLNGTTFTRNTVKTDSQGCCSYWDVVCPKCSNDEYVRNRLCSGMFTSRVSDLKRGRNPCRCSNAYRWTQGQRGYQLDKICEQENLTFIGWINEYKNCYSKFEWKCSEGHRNKSSVSDFLSSGKRCYTCHQESGFYGYYKDRTQEQDFLYIYKFKDLPFIKIGRTFRPEERLRENQTRVNTFYNNTLHTIEQLYLKEGTHQEIYDLEQYLLSEKFLDKRVCLEDGYGSSELLWEDCLEEVMTLVNILTKEN